jgi:hypothetical protein
MYVMRLSARSDFLNSTDFIIIHNGMYFIHKNGMKISVWKYCFHLQEKKEYSVWLRAGRPGDLGSILGGGKGFFL